MPTGGGGGAPTGGTGGGNQSGYCHLESHSYPYAIPPTPREARLFVISPVDGRVRDASKCMSLHPCADSGRLGPPPECLASDLNQQLDGAMPNGVGFDGLRSPEEALLVIAFYQPSDSSDDSGGCRRADLFACAGLAAPLGGGAYDITCASCEGGVRTTQGSDTGPCPKTLDKEYTCFLQTCDQILAASGFD